jgi:membrane-bound lytic murein transglycosylase B
MARARTTAALLIVLAVGAAAAVALAVTGQDAGTAPPGARTATMPSSRADLPPAAPQAPVPRGAAAAARDLGETTAALRRALADWRLHGDLGRRGPPRAVALLAARQQRHYRRLGSGPAFARRVLRRVDPALRAEARENVLARRALESIRSVVRQRPRIRVGRPAAPAALRRFYAAASRRFGVGWDVLAAVNFIESLFGRLRNESTAGARGPMQFLPATWRAYGMGGDVRDPHDAIMGAANLLHANGAPGRTRRALYAYNPSAGYVEAVLRYARRMRREPYAFLAYYSWPVPGSS